MEKVPITMEPPQRDQQTFRDQKRRELGDEFSARTILALLARMAAIPICAYAAPASCKPLYRVMVLTQSASGNFARVKHPLVTRHEVAA